MIYSRETSLASIYRQLEVSLEPKGYYNAIYQIRAGRPAPKIDYILRVHYGETLWAIPKVRIDRVTWGSDGLLSSRSAVNLASNDDIDPRQGLSSAQTVGEKALLAEMQALAPAGANLTNTSFSGARLSSQMTARDLGSDDKESSYYFVVEAFKFDEVRAMGKAAPCVWATFIALHAERGQTFTDVFGALLKAGSPYFGETTHGLQINEVPPGSVILGTPVELPGPVTK